MASVTVFVDDAVLGALPRICVIDGVDTDDQLTLTQSLGTRTGLGVAWLLVLAGPLGWIGLLVIAALRRGDEYLTVTLPFSEDAYLRRRRAQRSRACALGATAATLFGAFVAAVQHTSGYHVVEVALAVAGCVALWRVLVEDLRLRRASVRLSLDASRRWLTLAGVHDAFAAAAGRRDDIGSWMLR